MSNTPISLLMPMAGRGSRFGGAPKPLIMLEGRPFFVWAAESVRCSVQVNRMVFVVLEEHCRVYAMDRKIKEYYPDAVIVRLPEVSSGAAMTAMLGMEYVKADIPVAVNDCDHAFICSNMPKMVRRLEQADAALLCFRSDNPAYGYVRSDSDGYLLETAEKKVISNQAIAGCYLFSSPSAFMNAWASGAGYILECTTAELFMSGIYNRLVKAGRKVLVTETDTHISFGTPGELQAASEKISLLKEIRGRICIRN